MAQPRFDAYEGAHLDAAIAKALGLVFRYVTICRRVRVEVWAGDGTRWAHFQPSACPAEMLAAALTMSEAA